jgi:hypothetical protein
MGLDLFQVVPAELPLVILSTLITDKSKTYDDSIRDFLSIFKLDYNQREIIQPAIKLNQPIVLSGLVRKTFIKRETNKTKTLANNTFVSDIIEDTRYENLYKDKITDLTPIAVYQNNRIEFLDEIKRKMLKLKFVKDESSCEKSEDKNYKPLIHQMIVTRYLNSTTPYRGLLLYHGLGSGKTCSSISIIEGMKNTHRVFVMTPASLQANYKTQMKFCGNQIFKKNNYWEFKEMPATNKDAFFESLEINEKMLSHTKELKELFESQNGIWVIDKTKESEPNFDTLAEHEQLQIENQIKLLINLKYTFINYNGINKKRWAGYTAQNTINPFDHSVIIIDEVHNFVSRIVNKIRIQKKSISTEIYDAMLNAEDCKVVCLSGTPFINYPCELGTLFNIIGGYTFCLEVKIKTLKPHIDEKFFTTILTPTYIESYEYDGKSKKIKIIQVPYGFSKQESGQVLYDETHITREQFKINILELLKSNDSFVVENSEYVKYKKFPDTEVEFNKFFVTPDLKINNKEWFQSKISGMVSYLGDKAELMPEIINADDGNDIHMVYSEMSSNQIKTYVKIRQDERKMEGKPKKKESEDKMNSTYRVFSRACCNFSFPPSIERPMPSKALKKGVSEDDLDITDNESLLEDVDGKYDESDVAGRDIDSTYQQNINAVLLEFKSNPYKYFSSDIDKLVMVDDTKLVGDNPTLNMLSPKFYELLQNIINPQNIGCHLLYSTFRQLEGIGIFSLILRYYGFLELKVEQVGKSFKLVLEGMYGKEDYIDQKNKNVFALYTGTESPEQKEIIRNIYNSKYEALPNNIQSQLIDMYKDDDTEEYGQRIEDRRNKYGNIIKLLMITASGAEGIDLKNTRFVHIMEPYWHHVRMNQVIGRARRICSHSDLEPEFRNVTVYMYLSKFNDKQLKEEYASLKLQDDGISTDQMLYNIMERKRGLSVIFLDTLKEASIDCIVNYKDKCVSKQFSIKNKNKKLTGIDYHLDPLKKFETETEKKPIVAMKLATAESDVLTHYAVDKSKEPPILYDYKSYMKSRLDMKNGKAKEPAFVKVGTIVDGKALLIDK